METESNSSSWKKEPLLNNFKREGMGSFGQKITETFYPQSQTTRITESFPDAMRQIGYFTSIYDEEDTEHEFQIMSLPRSFLCFYDGENDSLVDITFESDNLLHLKAKFEPENIEIGIPYDSKIAIKYENGMLQQASFTADEQNLYKDDEQKVWHEQLNDLVNFYRTTDPGNLELDVETAKDELNTIIEDLPLFREDPEAAIRMLLALEQDTKELILSQVPVENHDEHISALNNAAFFEKFIRNYLLELQHNKSTNLQAELIDFVDLEYTFMKVYLDKKFATIMEIENLTEEGFQWREVEKTTISWEEFSLDNDESIDRKEERNSSSARYGQPIAIQEYIYTVIRNSNQKISVVCSKPANNEEWKMEFPLEINDALIRQFGTDRNLDFRDAKKVLNAVLSRN